jgi:hypothetical protein
VVVGLGALNHRPSPYQSSVIWFYNLQVGDCQNTRKSYKTSQSVGREQTSTLISQLPVCPTGSDWGRMGQWTGHFLRVDELLNRAKSVDWVRGSSTDCGEGRCEKRHQHHDQDGCHVDEWVGRADIEKK